MLRLTDEQFEELKKRILDGKKFLEGKWSSQNPEIKKWISLWYDLQDEYSTQQKLRGAKPAWDADAIRAGIEAKIQRNTERYIEAGIIPRSKERRTQHRNIFRSDRNPLFTTS